MSLQLKNFFVNCQCGKDLRMDTLDQKRTCTCGRIVTIAEPVKQYLQKEYSLPTQN